MNQAAICQEIQYCKNKAALSLLAAHAYALRDVFDNPRSMLYTYLLRLSFRIQ